VAAPRPESRRRLADFLSRVGKLPFDRSSPDLTAHAVRALFAWCGGARRERAAISAGLGYLRRAQRPDGAWTPLWFGNQHAPAQENPVYGTSRVLAAYHDLGAAACPEARRGVHFLLAAQQADGAWGETEVCPVPSRRLHWRWSPRLAPGRAGRAGRLRPRLPFPGRPGVRRGLSKPSPIGLYFARLWYSERLYP